MVTLRCPVSGDRLVDGHGVCWYIGALDHEHYVVDLDGVPRRVAIGRAWKFASGGPVDWSTE